MDNGVLAYRALLEKRKEKAPFWEKNGKRTIITRAEQSYGRVTVRGTLPFVHFRICSRCRTAGCQGISFSISSWVGDLPR